MRVQVQLGDLRAEAEGSPEEVMRFVSSFIGKHVPAYGLAQRLVSGPDLAQLVDALQDYIGFSEGEGFYIRPTIRVLSNLDRILLFLAKRKLENLMGRSQRSSASVPELTESLGLNAKTITARLAELTRHGLVQRVERGEYQVTTAGLEELLLRLKTSSK